MKSNPILPGYPFRNVINYDLNNRRLDLVLPVPLQPGFLLLFGPVLTKVSCFKIVTEEDPFAVVLDVRSLHPYIVDHWQTTSGHRHAFFPDPGPRVFNKFHSRIEAMVPVPGFICLFYN